ncbi:MAG: hypothetical protein GX660_27995 [Clostridiaceae bacterium]|nr:hypothetical protein [Clostridiaceae bacterium]
MLKILEGTETVFEVVRETLELQDGSLMLKFLDGAETIITKAELQAAMIAKGMGDKLDEVWQLCKVGCFSGDTLVFTKEGPKRIDEIKEGELVYSKNVNTGDFDYKKVLQVYIKSSKEFIRLKFEDEDIRTTPTHPFFVEEGWWKTAQNIKQGDRIVTASGQLKEVLAIEIEILSEPERIYNLNVEDYHTYFVGASGLLVHNGCKRVDYTNPAGRALYWVNQNVKNVNIAIDSALNSTNAGKALECKVADYIRNNIKEVTGFGQQVTRTVEKTFAGDLDIVTADAIIEVKKSIGAVSYDQIRKYADPSHADFLNNLNKKVILYIEEAVDMTNSNNVKMLNDIKAKEVSVVINSLEGLKEVLS